jgi:hypothetical protein
MRSRSGPFSGTARAMNPTPSRHLEHSLPDNTTV